DEMRRQLPKYMVRQAERQGIEKFGPIIANQVGKEYREMILPKVGQVMQGIVSELDEDSIQNLELTGEPSAGMGEKIFHVSNTKDGKNIVRFHVRRDHPPQDGYWFNFHYHLPKDHFQKHYELGKIFWNKDTPPKWKA